MSSTKWPKTMEGIGILNAHITANPLGWGSNLVYIPYCTSDLWLGDIEADGERDFHFRGALVIEKVIEALIEKEGMSAANSVLLTGTSAGALGVMLHIDNISKQIRKTGSDAVVRGISDSGWFVETEKTKNKGSIQYWQVNKTISQECMETHSDSDWKCLYGVNIYPRIKSPLMIIQFYFDDFQMELNGIQVDMAAGASGIHQQDERLQQLVDKVTSSLSALETVFGVSCYGHGVLDSTELYTQLKVQEVSLQKAIQCWIMDQCPQRNMDYCQALHPNNTEPCNYDCMRLLQRTTFFSWNGRPRTRDPTLPWGQTTESP